MPHRPHFRKTGLARSLSKLGYCSRSQAFDLIRSGRVTLNARVRRDPETPVDLDRDAIAVDHKPVAAARRVYLMLNKPRGVVTTASDERGRDTVYGLLPPGTPWVAPVGRLDKASEGLLLLTNDSEWGARIVAPESHLPKTYHVQIAAIADDSLLASLCRGVLDSGERLHASSLHVIRGGEKNTWIEVVLEEGKNRHIRRMMDALGVEVLRLVRVSIGPLQLDDLPKGSVRHLTLAEKLSLE